MGNGRTMFSHQHHHLMILRWIKRSKTSLQENNFPNICRVFFLITKISWPSMLVLCVILTIAKAFHSVNFELFIFIFLTLNLLRPVSWIKTKRGRKKIWNWEKFTKRKRSAASKASHSLIASLKKVTNTKFREYKKWNFQFPTNHTMVTDRRAYL